MFIGNSGSLDRNRQEAQRKKDLDAQIGSQSYMDDDLRRAMSMESEYGSKLNDAKSRLAEIEARLSSGKYSSQADRERDMASRSNMLHNISVLNLNTSTPESKMLRARSAQRQGLLKSIEEAPEFLQKEQDILRQDAARSLGEGLTGTRRNYNRRGLLYSGLRKAGEEQVKGGVNVALAEGLTGARRDTANLIDQRRAAIASLGLQSEAQALNLASQAFEDKMRNEIARRQAFQQFGQGVGSVAGMMLGSGNWSQTPNSTVSGSAMYDSTIGPSRYSNIA